MSILFFFFQAEDGIRDLTVTGVQTCALPICARPVDGLVLSGVPGIVLSGVGLSCYQACPSAAKPMLARVSASLNFPNLNSLTGSSSAAFRWTTTQPANESHENQQRQPGSPAGRSRP